MFKKRSKETVRMALSVCYHLVRIACMYGGKLRLTTFTDRCSLLQGGSPDDMIVTTDMIHRYDDALIRGDGWMDGWMLIYYDGSAANVIIFKRLTIA